MTNETIDEEAGSPEVGQRRILTRSRRDRMVAGVAGGLADYFAVDPIVFRIAFVALALTGGGFLLYGGLWLLLPREGSKRPILRLSRGPLDHQRGIMVLVGVVALVALLDHDHGGWFGGSFLGAALLIGLGVWLLSGGASGALKRDGRSTGRTGGVEETSVVAPTLEERVTGLGEPPSPYPWHDPIHVPPEPEPPRSRVTAATLSVLLVSAGVAALVGITLDAFLAIALMIVGAALVWSAWRHRNRALICVGLVLLVVLTAASLVDINWHIGMGERNVAPATLSELRRSYSLGAGTYRIDLTRLPDRAESTAAPRRLSVDVTMGEIVVVLPSDVAAIVDAEVGAGEIVLPGRPDNGGTQVVERARVGRATGRADYLLDLEVGLGMVEVVRRAA